MSAKELKEMQDRLDEMKYRDSQKLDKDLCGTYSFCKFCNKRNKYPCASAYYKNEKKWV